MRDAIGVIALLYDVHGNLPALDAAVADAEAAGAQRWILGGDYALFGGWPAETVARLRELVPAVWIRGNGERWTADPSSAPDDAVVQGAIGAAREALGRELVDDLALAAVPRRTTARRVAYDHAASAALVRQQGGAWSGVVAERIERSRMNV